MSDHWCNPHVVIVGDVGEFRCDCGRLFGVLREGVGNAACAARPTEGGDE